MTSYFKDQKNWNVLYVFIILSMYSCTQIPEKPSEVIRVGKSVVTIADFNSAFEIMKSGYKHQDLTNLELKQQMKRQLLDQMLEELIIIERARELQIEVSEEELENAVYDIRKDYPDEKTFKDIFLSEAISFQSWKDRLKIRLLLDKTTAQDLESTIKITNDDIVQFMATLDTGELPIDPTHPLPPISGDINDVKDSKKIERFLRKERSKDLFRSWINELKERYSIIINKELV